MKIIKIVVAVAVSFFMLAYMIFASVLWAIDLSFDEKNIQNVLETSDVLPSLMQSAELRINSELEENAEDIVEKFGGDPTDIELNEMYRLPEVTALFANVFTNSTRHVLYGEEYTEVDEELVEAYLCAVVNYSIGRSAPEAELEDYLAVSLDVYTERFNESIANMAQAFSEEDELIETARFFYTDMKIFATFAAVAHMLVLILLVKGKLGYFTNAAVFGLSGITMLAVSASLPSIIGDASDSSIYTQMFAEIFRSRFALLGAVLFAVFAALMLTAMVISIYKTPKEKE